MNTKLLSEPQDSKLLVSFFGLRGLRLVPILDVLAFNLASAEGGCYLNKILTVVITKRIECVNANTCITERFAILNELYAFQVE